MTECDHAQGIASDAGTVLIASTSWWAFPSRIAIAFAALGFRVEAICPPGHPLRSTRAVKAIHRYHPVRAEAALASAVLRAKPSLIVPCDDLAVRQLHAVAARDDGNAVAAAIRRSLGSPHSHAIVDSRSRLIAVARECGVLAPVTTHVDSLTTLREAIAQTGLPLMMKVDGTCGGLGVKRVTTLAEAEDAFRRMTMPPSALGAFKRVVVNRDMFSAAAWLKRERPPVSIQKYVAGRPANTLVACWEGEVLATISVEVLQAQTAIGASTVVRVIENPMMAEAARRLVSRLGLSGFCGFDFMIEQVTGLAHLVEMNPRSTPLSHLSLGSGRDPVASLAARLMGRRRAVASADTTGDVIAFFPQAWLLDPASPLLRTAFHDVPWQEPELVRELVKQPWPERSILARASRALQRGLAARRQEPGRWQDQASPASAEPFAEPGRAEHAAHS